MNSKILIPYSISGCRPSLHPKLKSQLVGDDDQSIYGWRGIKVENVKAFSKDFKDVHIIKLEQNYRSTNKILSAANTVIQNNSDRLGKNLWTESLEGDNLTLYAAFNEQEEARFIASSSKDWMDGGGCYEDIAILYRSNAQSRALEEAFASKYSVSNLWWVTFL